MNKIQARCMGLDILRVCAVVLVLTRHLHFPENENHFFLKWLCNGGWVGVDIFFVLSGYLVSGLLFREFQRDSSISIKRFLIRRGFKIYPPFWMLLIITILCAAIRNEMLSARSIIGELGFLQNYGSGLWNHTWSLAVEEHFYLFLSLWVFCVWRLFGCIPLNAVVISFVFIAVICLVLRILAWSNHDVFSFKVNVFPTHLRIDSLMYGVLLSYFNSFSGLEKRIAPMRSWQLLALGLIFISPAYFCKIEEDKWISTFGFSLIYIGAGFLCLLSIRFNRLKSYPLELIAKLGENSYSVYLFHMPVNAALVKLIGDLRGVNFYIYVFIYLIASFLIGVVGARMIEVPMIKIRDKLYV